jgi:NADP-dependent 3-hydroxy acid dehydrogenase YdfG
MRAVLDRNLLSTILTCQAIAKEMMRQRKGRIVTIGSVAAFKGRTNGSIYAVAKAGMTHYTRCLADHSNRTDVRFARPSIQIYDAPVVDLYPWVCARYLVGVKGADTKAKRS